MSYASCMFCAFYLSCIIYMRITNLHSCHNKFHTCACVSMYVRRCYVYACVLRVCAWESVPVQYLSNESSGRRQFSREASWQWFCWLSLYNHSTRLTRPLSNRFPPNVPILCVGFNPKQTCCETLRVGRRMCSCFRKIISCFVIKCAGLIVHVCFTY